MPMSLAQHHEKEWRRCILNAGGSEDVARQTITLASLNGLFEPHQELQQVRRNHTQELRQLQQDHIGAHRMSMHTVRHIEDLLTDAQADAARLHKQAADRWDALLELQCRDDRDNSLPPAYRKIIDDALENRPRDAVDMRKVMDDSEGAP